MRGDAHDVPDQRLAASEELLVTTDLETAYAALRRAELHCIGDGTSVSGGMKDA
jgi:hypothetical protein